MKDISETKLDAPSALDWFPWLRIPRSSAAALDLHKARVAATYVIFALLALGIVTLQTQHFRARPYRQDEAWIVDAALEKSSTQAMVQWVANDIHPPLWLIMAKNWVDVFGQNELIVRYSSTLLTLVSLALLFRLASDLVSSRTSMVPLAAVFLLGTASFFQFYSQEFRPYPALITCTLGMIWAFMRWLRRPNFPNALLFVGFGIAALYVHFFAVYVLAALVVFFLIFVRWNPRLYLRAFGLWFAVGASYLGWLLPFLYAIRVASPNGVDYALKSNADTLAILWRLMSTQPYPLVGFLLLTSLFMSLRLAPRPGEAPVASLRQRFRFDPWWRQGYVLVVGVMILVFAFGVNLFLATLTQRELVVLLPLAALFVAFGFAGLPRPAQLAFVVLVLPSAFAYIDYEYPGPQAQVAAYIAHSYQFGNPIILNIPDEPRQVAVLYYVQNRLGVPVANKLIWQVLLPNPADIRVLPYPPVHLMTDESASTIAQLHAFLNGVNKQQVWYIETAGGNFFSAPIENVLKAQYKVYNQNSWKGEYTVIQYLRRPSTS